MDPRHQLLHDEAAGSPATPHDEAMTAGPRTSLDTAVPTSQKQLPLLDNSLVCGEAHSVVENGPQLNPSSLRGKRSRAEQDEGLLLGESRSSCKRLEQQAGPAADTSQDHAATGRSTPKSFTPEGAVAGAPIAHMDLCTQKLETQERGLSGLPAGDQRVQTAGSPGAAPAELQAARLLASLPLVPPATVALLQPNALHRRSGSLVIGTENCAGAGPRCRLGAHAGGEGCGAAVSPGLPHSGSDRSFYPSASGSGSGRSFCRDDASQGADVAGAAVPPRSSSGTGSDGRTACDAGRGSGSGSGSGAGSRGGSGNGSGSGSANAAAAAGGQLLRPHQHPHHHQQQQAAHPHTSINTIGTAATMSCGPEQSAPLAAALHSSWRTGGGPDSTAAPAQARFAAAGAGRDLGPPCAAQGAAAADANDPQALEHADVDLDEQLDAVPATTAGSVLDMVSTQLGAALPQGVNARLKKRIRIIQPISRAWEEETFRTPSGTGGGGGGGGDHGDGDAAAGDMGGSGGSGCAGAAAAGHGAGAAAAGAATSTDCGICRQDSSASGRTVQGKAPALTPLRATGTARPASSAAGLEGRGAAPAGAAAVGVAATAAGAGAARTGDAAAALVQCHRACSQDASRLAMDLQATASGRAAGAMASAGTAPAASDRPASDTVSLDLLAAAAADESAAATAARRPSGAGPKQEGLMLLPTELEAPALADVDMAECSPFGLGVSGVLPGLTHHGGARAGDVSTLLGLPSTRAAAAACMPPPRQHSGGATPGSKAAGGPPETPGKTVQGADTLGFASVFLPPHPSNALRNGSLDIPKHGDKPTVPAAADAGGPQATMQPRPPPPAVAAAPSASCGRAQAAANGNASVAAGAAHSVGHLLRVAPTAGAGGSRACGGASGALGCGAMRGPASSGALPAGPGSVSAATATDALPSVCPPSAVPVSMGAATAAAAPANRPTALGPGDPLRLLHQQPPACLGRVQGELTLLYQWYVANKTVYLDQARQQLQRVESLTAQAVSNAAAVAAAAATSGGPHAAGDAAIALSSAAMARAESSEAIRAFETALQIMRVCSKVEQQSVAAGGELPPQQQQPHPLLHPQAVPQPPRPLLPLGVPLAAWQADVAAAAAAGGSRGMPPLHFRQPMAGQDSRESADLAVALAASQQQQQQQPTGGATAAGVPPDPWAAMAPGPEAALAVAAALVGASGLGGRAKAGKARSAGAAEAARLPQLPLLVPPGGLGSPQQPSPRGLPLRQNHTCAAAADALAPATLAALGTEMAALSGPPAAAASAPLLAALPNTGLPAAAHPGGRAKA